MLLLVFQDQTTGPMEQAKSWWECHEPPTSFTWAFADDEPISLDMFLKLGKGKACDKKQEFKQKLKNRQAASQEWLVNCIKSQDTADIQTFKGGCEALFSWFDQFIPPRGVIEER
jgi:hypothetical protein